MTARKNELTIVMVEDDPGHALLIEKNLRRAGITSPIVPFRDGGEAMEFISRQEAGSSGPQVPPFLVLLDLDLPALDGYQVLSRIKGERRTRDIPVMIISLADSLESIERCYRLGCNGYITKPVDAAVFTDVVLKLGKFLAIISVPEVTIHHG